MIVPINADFPKTRLVKEQKTKFCLEIPKTADRSKVKEEVQKLGAEMLLFLRKLKSINVTISDADENLQSNYKLYRDDLDADGSGTIIRLSRTSTRPKRINEVEELSVFRHTITGMPLESEREGIAESEIVIAFPHSKQAIKKGSNKRNLDFEEDEEEETQTSRTCYNFLPIRDFGFSFLLHADFILAASRQDILEDHAWNERLKKEAGALFTRCVISFSKSSKLRFEWPQFMIANHDATDTIMHGFMKALRKQLSKKNILESQAGTLKPPKELLVVRELWKDADGRPLLDDDKHLDKYVSPEYPPSILRSLGIVEQTTKDCMTWLAKMEIDNIQQKSAAWHSSLAKAIIGDSADLKKIMSVKLIPLRNGGWASGEEQTFFSEGAMIDVPEGIDCAIVDDDAASDRTRSLLFKHLGISSITPDKVCEQIIGRHGMLTTSRSTGLTLSAMIDHIWYLYKADHDPVDPRTVKLFTQDGKIESASN